jgi:hypothetical protein
MDEPRVVGTMLPHESFGAADCCGCLNGIVRGDVAEITCNECDAVVRTVPAAKLQDFCRTGSIAVSAPSAACLSSRTRLSSSSVYIY